MNAQGLLGTGESCSSSTAAHTAQYRGTVTGRDASGDALSKLAATDPKRFDRVMNAIADELQTIAHSTDEPRHDFLSAMANQFETAAAQHRPPPVAKHFTPPAVAATNGTIAKGATAPNGAHATSEGATSTEKAGASSEARAEHHHHHHRHHHRGQGVGKPAPYNAENLVAKIVDAVNAALSNGPKTNAATSTTESTAPSTSSSDETSTTPPSTDET